MSALRQLDVQSSQSFVATSRAHADISLAPVRDYHSSSYLPHNITLIVAGRSLSPTALLTTLQDQVEPSIIAHKQNKGPHPAGWKRPFVDSDTATNKPVITENKRETVEFPERDESVGEIMMSWVGVGQKEFETDLALEVLGEYLTESAVSPLYREFVEIEEPACTGAFLVAPQSLYALLMLLNRHYVPRFDRGSVNSQRLPLFRPLRASRHPRRPIQSFACSFSKRGDRHDSNGHDYRSTATAFARIDRD